MKRSRYGLLLLALLVPACKSTGPKTPAAPPAPLPDLLRPYEEDLRLLAHKGDERTLTLQVGQSLTGTCDVAVRIRRVTLEPGAVRFGLETLGEARLGERRAACKSLQPGMQLTITGFPPGPVTPEVTARIDEVLLTSEAYLRAKGVAFELPADAPPSEAASELSDADEGERRLARKVVAWPRPLLSVDATYHDLSGRSRHERLIRFEAVVGTDGRLHRPQIQGSPDPRHEAALTTALRLWRFEPARTADGRVAARIAAESVFRVY